MCGIAGFYVLDEGCALDKDKLLDILLDEIEHRGGDATGFVAIGDEGVLEWQKAACGASDFMKYRRPVPEGTRIVIAHTRWATQGLPGFTENNHPIRRGPFFVIHNGHVLNDDKLFAKAKRDRYGQVDSEAIAALLASHGSLHQVDKVMEKIEGDAAIAAVDEREPKLLALARGNGSPLHVLQSKKVLLFGSTPNAVLQAHRKTIGSIGAKRAEAVPEGRVILIKDGKPHIQIFKPKRMVIKKTWKNDWKDITPDPSMRDEEKAGRIPEGDEWACDFCSELYSWKELEYETVDGTTYTICWGCQDDLHGVPALAYDDLTGANAEILQRLDR